MNLKNNYKDCRFHKILTCLDPRQEVIFFLRDYFKECFLGRYDINSLYVYWELEDARYTVLLRYKGDLEFKELHRRQLNIIREVFDFCESHDNLFYDLRQCTIHYTKSAAP